MIVPTLLSSLLVGCSSVEDAAPDRTPSADELEDLQDRAALEAIGYLSGEDDVASAETGVVVHDRAQTQPGRNVVTSADGPVARLMDADGSVLHTWRAPFAEAFPDVETRSRNTGWFRRVHPLPDGELLAIYEGEGIVRLDRDSTVLWARPNRAHHDISVTTDGQIWTLTRSRRRETPYGRRLTEDFVTLLSADGKEIRRHSVLQALIDSPYRPVLDAFMASDPTDPVRANELSSGDVLHTNAVRLLDGPAGTPFEAGNLLLSSRVLSLLMVMDGETGDLVWATQGDFDGQHDPHLLDDGSILLFDNGATASKLLRIDADGKTTWTWSRPGFFTQFCGAVQPLDNGNLLAAESLRGRAVEVTPQGEVVWQLDTPWTAFDDENKVANLLEVERVAPDYGDDWL